MKKITLTGEEAQLIFSALDNGDPQRGLSLTEIRSLLPVMDKLEAQAERLPLVSGQGERFVFKDGTMLLLKESEFTTMINKLETSGGWASALVGRKVIRLIDRLKETPTEPDAPAEK